MIRKAIVLVLLASCAHTRGVVFPDGSGDRKTVWVCAPDPQNQGDIACLDMRVILERHPELRPCEPHSKSEM